MKLTLTILTSLLMLTFTTTSKAQNTQNFTFQGNVFQQYIVPATGWYFLDASGAQGGPASNNSHVGGQGARMQGYVQLNFGDTLRIAVGGQGGIGTNAGNNVSGGGGGGGSSIIKITNGTYTPLLMAGGGGGGAANYNGSPGLSSQNGGFSWGGSNGGGGGLGSNSSAYGGAGGAGFSGDGGTHYDGITLMSYGGQAYVSGNNGGNSSQNGGDGGWGGGGEGGPAKSGTFSNHDGGGAGGGGYSGGGGGANEGDGGGGGGSYVASSLNTSGCLAEEGVQAGNGIVSIDYLPFSNTSVDTIFTFQGNVFQYFTAPATGYYMFKVRGAQGGSVNTSAGGKGAHMQGYLLLRAGEVIKIAAGGVGQNGQYGSPNHSTFWTGGGGGGSSSVVTTENIPLIIAGGGGGAGYSNAGGNGLKDNSFSTTGSGGNGGISGTYGSSGGGGYYSDGGVCAPSRYNPCSSSQPGQSLLNGNYGGGSGFSIGGWGGGAQGADVGIDFNCPLGDCNTSYDNAPGGGGGGYNGGNGAQEGNSASGGGSFSTALCGQSDSSGVNSGNGSVSISGPNVAIDTVNTAGPTYTWAASGVTYQHSGTYYYVDQANCIVRMLDLSIGGTGGCLNYNRIDTTIVSCGSYTNPLNGRTYTENTTDSFRLGCNFYVVRLIVSRPRTVLAPSVFVIGLQYICLGATPQLIYPSNPHDHLTHDLVECKNTTDTFYTAEVPYATSYSWQLPAGATGSSTTNRIVVNFGNNFNGGYIRVTPVNTCGNGDTLSMNIVLPAHVPTGRLQISGPSAPFISGNYSVAPIAGATMYTWSVSNNQARIVSGQGTPMIHLEALPGITRANLSVVASNCRGNGARGNMPLNNNNNNNGGNLGMLMRNASTQPADISVYPNPSNGQFTISTPSLKTDATLEVYSTDGRLVYQLTIPSTTKETSIDLQHPAAGLYQVRIIAGGEVSMTKVVVN